ncbi:KTI12-like protein [Vairimorpha necatrix]|uniref:KTI12-like protein n=1 Tax=Vairimorpha necatrix TaxID=6039 RepID=A0AAX4JAS3_9MICR
MPVLIFLNDTKHLLPQLTSSLSSFDIEIHKDNFLSTRSLLSNMSSTKLYILLNCDLKPHRYEIYCLAKKQESAYCILSTEPLSGAKHDNPHILINSEILNEPLLNEIMTCLNRKLVPTTAHKKKIVNDNNYLSSVKVLINKVNDECTGTLKTVKKDCEHKLLKMLNINPIDIKEIEELYKKMLEEASC